jgi:HEAT repeat protein
VKTTAFEVLAIVLASAALAAAQLSSTGEYPVRKRGVSQDPSDAAVRYQTHALGKNPDEWAQHLDDADPARRLEAVKLLASTGDAASERRLIEAVDNQDPRVATLAVDTLGRMASRDAAAVLSQKLLLNGPNPAFRGHVLSALGRIRDPSTARNVITFVESEKDPELRASAIRVLGEIGDDSIRGDLKRLAESDANPNEKVLWNESLGKISARESTTGEARSTAAFSHTEGGR